MVTQTNLEKKKPVRTLKVQLKLGDSQKQQLDTLLRASRDCYNILVQYARYLKKNHQRVLACPIRYSEGFCCPLREKPEDSTIHPGRSLVIDPVMRIEVKKDKQKEYRNAYPYYEVLDKGISMLDEGNKPWDVLQAVHSHKYCVWPREDVIQKIKNGKRKGETKLVIATQQEKKNAEYGISGKSANCVARAFEGQIESFLTHRKQGNRQAQFPYKFKGYYPLLFNKDEIRIQGKKLRLGTKKHGITLVLHELARGCDFTAAKITKNRSGEYYLHLSVEIKLVADPKLSGIGAIDLGQKRAMVLANQKGETATISGANVCAIKRSRDRRYREINRLRNRVYRAQIRQYLSPEEQEKAKKDSRYGWRMIRQRRREGKDGKGRSLVALGQQVESKPLRKRSKRDRKLYQAIQKVSARTSKALNYANHCITRAAVDWAVEQEIGKLYVGDLHSLPKGRKKGQRRMKQVARNNLWEWPTWIEYLEQKILEAGGTGVVKASERYTSQTCPNCRAMNKPKGRKYRCKACGWKGDRDQVGAVNFLNRCLEVETGTSSNLKPGHNQNLRIAPAVRKIHSQKERVGTPLVRPSAENVLNEAECEPVEEAAKGHAAVTQCAYGEVFPRSKALELPETRSVSEGCRQVEEQGIGATFETPATNGIGDTCSQLTTLETGASKKRRRRSAQPSAGIQLELDLWPSAP